MVIFIVSLVIALSSAFFENDDNKDIDQNPSTFDSTLTSSFSSSIASKSSTPKPTKDPDPIIECNFNNYCGDKSIKMKKSECEKTVCCFVGDDKYEILSMRDCYNTQQKFIQEESKKYQEAIKKYNDEYDKLIEEYKKLEDEYNRLKAYNDEYEKMIQDFDNEKQEYFKALEEEQQKQNEEQMKEIKNALLEECKQRVLDKYPYPPPGVTETGERMGQRNAEMKYCYSLYGS